MKLIARVNEARNEGGIKQESDRRSFIAHAAFRSAVQIMIEFLRPVGWILQSAGHRPESRPGPRAVFVWNCARQVGARSASLAIGRTINQPVGQAQSLLRRQLQQLLEFSWVPCHDGSILSYSFSRRLIFELPQPHLTNSAVSRSGKTRTYSRQSWHVKASRRSRNALTTG